MGLQVGEIGLKTLLIKQIIRIIPQITNYVKIIA